METNQAVLDKIAKLLAMANNAGASENEAEQASQHVQRLLQLHNLSLSQVENATGKAGGREKAKFGSAVRPWQVALMKALSRANFCLHQVASSPGQGIPASHLIVGRQVNVEATRMTYEYLLEALRRALSEAGYTETEPRVTSRGTKYSKEGQWFLEGAANRLADRLEIRRREAEAESAAQARAAQGNGTHQELVLSDVYGTEADLNNDALNNFPAGTTAARRRKTLEEEAVRQAQHDELMKQGHGSTEAWYLLYGYPPLEAKAAALVYERNNRRTRSTNWTRGSAREYQKVNSNAFRAGRAAGSAIGLDKQISAGGNAKKLTGKVE